jgi:hypothetical protein
VPKTASTSLQIELSKCCGAQDILSEVNLKYDQVLQDIGYKGPQNCQMSFWKLQPQDWYRIIFMHKSPKVSPHMTASRIQKYIGKFAWDSYFKFCVVRNPFDRAISLYYWRLKNLPDKPDLNRYILSMKAGKLSTWNRYTINNELAVDLVCRYENLQLDLETVAAKIGIEPLVLPHAMTSFRKDRRDYHELINPEARAHIEHLCKKEIRAFNYGWDA